MEEEEGSIWDGFIEILQDFVDWLWCFIKCQIYNAAEVFSYLMEYIVPDFAESILNEFLPLYYVGRYWFPIELMLVMTGLFIANYIYSQVMILLVKITP